MQRIAELLRRFGMRGPSLELPCLVSVHKGDVRLHLLEVALPCGHSGYRIDLEYHVQEQDRWVEIASLRDYNLDETLELLKEAQWCIHNLQSQE